MLYIFLISPGGQWVGVSGHQWNDTSVWCWSIHSFTAICDRK